MKKNLYFREQVRRENHIKNFIYDTAMSLASYPKACLEVFIRSNPGERYFSLAANLSVAFILIVLPLGLHKLPFLSDFGANYNSFQEYNEAHAFGWSFLWHYASWYAYIVVFLIFTRRRWLEVRRNPGVFDFTKYTKYAGNIDLRFFNFHPLGLQPSIRSVECIYEPAAFFVAGIALSLLGQRIGAMLMVSSIVYGLSYAALYKQGDNFIMDKIDEQIINEGFEDTFVKDHFNDPRGRFHMDKPRDENLRRKLRDSIIVDDRRNDEITFAE